MKKNQLFFNLNENFTGKRVAMILILLFLGAGVLYYFNKLGKELEERELKYAALYAESLSFFTAQSITSDCDYTFVQEVLEANESIPIIVTIEGIPYISTNIPELEDSTKKFTETEKQNLLLSKLEPMKTSHKPLEININDSAGLVYFSNSDVVNQLRFFPFVLIGTFLIFGSLAFIAYSSARRAEENKVWVGLAKETAHQLGTPISALVAWVEVLRSNPNFDASIADEMDKDLKRLDTITRRFSNIGSIPSTKSEEIGGLVYETIEYLKRRISTKINWHFDNQLTESTYVILNKQLIEWVIENLCKNAVDAMSGVGNLDIKISSLSNNKIAIDIKDDGKGISNSQLRKIFRPGYSSKKRGWGLGLTLAKRIVEVYHDGSLLVKETFLGKGTTFRLILKTDLK